LIIRVIVIVLVQVTDGTFVIKILVVAGEHAAVAAGLLFQPLHLPVRVLCLKVLDLLVQVHVCFFHVAREWFTDQTPVVIQLFVPFTHLNRYSLITFTGYLCDFDSILKMCFQSNFQVAEGVGLSISHVGDAVAQSLVSHHVLSVCNGVVQIDHGMPPVLRHEHCFTWLLHEQILIVCRNVLGYQHSRQLISELVNGFFAVVCIKEFFCQSNLFVIFGMQNKPKFVTTNQSIPRRS